MKIKSGFIKREIAGRFVVVPLKENAVNINGVIDLTETASFLWDCLREEQTEERLISRLLSEYEVNEREASEDVKDFICFLEKNQILE